MWATTISLCVFIYSAMLTHTLLTSPACQILCKPASLLPPEPTSKKGSALHLSTVTFLLALSILFLSQRHLGCFMCNRCSENYLFVGCPRPRSFKFGSTITIHLWFTMSSLGRWALTTVLHAQDVSVDVIHLSSISPLGLYIVQCHFLCRPQALILTLVMFW